MSAVRRVFQFCQLGRGGRVARSGSSPRRWRSGTSALVWVQAFDDKLWMWVSDKVGTHLHTYRI